MNRLSFAMRKGILAAICWFLFGACIACDALGDGKPDCQNNAIDGEGDLNDIFPLRLSGLGDITAEDLPSNARLEFHATVADGDLVNDHPSARMRLFTSRNPSTAREIIGPTSGGNLASFPKGSPFMRSLLGTDDTILGVEGVQHGSEMIVTVRFKIGDEVIAEDSIRLLVAPFIVLSNCDTAKKVYRGNNGWPSFNLYLAAALEDRIDFAINGDNYIQDYGEFCQTTCWNGELWTNRVSILGFLGASYDDIISSDIGYVAMSPNPPNIGGNVEASPPSSVFPHGRIIVGSNVDEHTKNVLRNQKVQVDNGDIIELNVNWLLVGHVDEVLTFIPAQNEAGYQLLVADLSLATNLLVSCLSEFEIEFTNTYGTASSIISFYEENPDRTTQIISSLTNIETTLIRELQIDDSLVSNIPILFDPTASLSRALLPNTVNSLVLSMEDDFMVVMPEPRFTPFYEDIAVKLSSLGYSASNFILIPADELRQGGGFIHCASNVERER